MCSVAEASWWFGFVRMATSPETDRRGPEERSHVQSGRIARTRLIIGTAILLFLAFAVRSSTTAAQVVTETTERPQFLSGTSMLEVRENSPPGTEVGDPVTATHVDDDTLNYSITGSGAGLFDIDSSSGQITVAEDAVLGPRVQEFPHRGCHCPLLPRALRLPTWLPLTFLDMSLGSAGDRYDDNKDEVIDRDEVIRAIGDYFDSLLDRDGVLEIIRQYLFPATEPVPRYVAVSGGNRHTCALQEDDVPTCWGSNEVGQSSPPEGAEFTVISSGSNHTCGLREDGTAVCWGNDEDGQSSPPGGERFSAISAGYAHTCGLREEGTAACWGNDEDGQSSPPEDERLTTIASGGIHTCGLREDGTAVCWGIEPFFTGYEGWEETPEGQFIALDAAGGYTCGLRRDGSPECWGAVSDVVFQGQFPDSFQRLTTITVQGRGGCGLWKNGTPVCWGFGRYDYPLSQRFTDISAGGDHTCAIRVGERDLVCWGDDEHGQASPPGGERFIGPEPEPVSPQAPEVPLVSISSGDDHACGLDGDGVVHCWGSNDYGRSTPPAGEKFISVSAGEDHTCGVLQDGPVLCWGVDDFGQASPSTAGGPFVSVSSGGHMTCALRQDGTGECWGDSIDGEEPSPSEGERFTAISGGGFHACGLRLDGLATVLGKHVVSERLPTGGRALHCDQQWDLPHMCPQS